MPDGLKAGPIRDHYRWWVGVHGRIHTFTRTTTLRQAADFSAPEEDFSAVVKRLSGHMDSCANFSTMSHVLFSGGGGQHNLSPNKIRSMTRDEVVYLRGSGRYFPASCAELECACPTSLPTP